MRVLFQLQQVLLEKGIYFCIQSGGVHDFLNVAIENKKGERKHYRQGTLEDIEQQLLEDFGYLISEKPVITIPTDVKFETVPSAGRVTPLPALPPLPPMPRMT